jgi:hypothetical protein
MDKAFFQTIFLATRNFFSTDAGKALIIAILWQLIMMAIGIIFDTSLSSAFEKIPGSTSAFNPLDHTYHWDSGWYGAIITNNAYADPSSAASVFYPLLPALGWLVKTLSFGLLSLSAVGLIINTVSLFFAVLALVKIADHFVAKQYRWWVPAIFLTFPSAIFLHFFYTEAIFCALAFWAYLFALRRQWWKMAMVLALLTATRLPAILFIGLCALEFFRAHQWSIKKIFNKNLLWFLLTPLGFVIFGLYLHIVRGDFFAMLGGYKLTDDWEYQVFNPNLIETYTEVLRTMKDAATTAIPFDQGIVVNYLIPFAGIAVLIAASLYGLRYKAKKGVPLALFGIAATIMFSLNSNLISVHRYLLPCVVIYIAVVHFATSRSWLRFIFYASLYIGVMFQAYLYILFLNGYFAG